MMNSLFLPIFLALTLAAPPAASPNVSDAVLLRRAVVELTAEAEQALTDQRLPRQEPTFAREFLQRSGRASVDGKLVFKRLLRPLGKDPFIDAYVRWQLLGFGPVWPDDDRTLDDEDFELFLAELPALAMNPRSDREAIARINAALAREIVNDADAEALRQLDQSLRERSAEVQNLNRPALEFRRWIEEQCGNTGHRHHQARLERLDALVAAGWPTEELKRQIARRFEEARRDRSFTPEQRARVASQAARLVGRRVPIIQSVGVGENNSPQAQFDETAVYDFEVNEWIRLLQDK